LDTLLDRPDLNLQAKITFEERVSDTVNNATESWRKQKQDLANSLPENQ
jgi:hypothetical protein